MQLAEKLKKAAWQHSAIAPSIIANADGAIRHNSKPEKAPKLEIFATIAIFWLSTWHLFGAVDLDEARLRLPSGGCELWRAKKGNAFSASQS